MHPTFKKPSAWVPIVISLTVLAIMLFSFIVYGSHARQPDEGTGAHLFQIWLVLEALMITFFAIKSLPQTPKQALLILAIQIAAVLMGMAPVLYFKL